MWRMIVCKAVLIAVFTRMYGTCEEETPVSQGKPKLIPYICLGTALGCEPRGEMGESRVTRRQEGKNRTDDRHWGAHGRETHVEIAESRPA
jgi:hypothetical protein